MGGRRSSKTTEPFGRASKAEKLRRWAFGAIQQHAANGTLPTSLRHLFYEAVMAKIVAKGDPAKKDGRGRRPDQNLTEAVTWLREHGLVEWSAIEDRTRHISNHCGHGATIRDGVADLLDGIRLDPWDDVLPIIVTESESVAGVLERLAERYRVPIIPTRGQSNGWLRTDVADRFDDRPVVVCYLGDADKAGDDIENNTKLILSEVLDIEDWVRVGLTWDQVTAHELPPVDRYDKRDKITREVCEIEALPQRILMDDVTAYLDRWLRVDLDDVQERERAERRQVAQLLA